MRLLNIPLTGGVGLGPLTHCLAVAYEARKRGHQVAFICRESFAHIVKKFSYKVYHAPSSKPNGIKSPPFRLSDVAVELGLVDKSYINTSLEIERKTIKTFRPDIIFTETQLSVAISAAVEKVPFAAVTSWADHPNFKSPLFANNDTPSGFEKNYNYFFDKYNLPLIKDVCELGFLRANLKIAPTIPALQPELKQVENVHYVGHLLSPEMEEGNLPKEIEDRKGNKPMVYVYMSPGDISPKDWVATIVNTFRKSEFNLMITLSPLSLSPNSLPHLKNIKFYKSLPGGAASRRADLIITHGGSNTIANALLSGKPMMIFSHFYAERDYNGRAVEKYKAGFNFRTEQFNTKVLLYNARKIISNKSYYHNAQKLGMQLQSYGGAKKAVDLLEEFVKKTV